MQTFQPGNPEREQVSWNCNRKVERWWSNPNYNIGDDHPPDPTKIESRKSKLIYEKVSTTAK